MQLPSLVFKGKRNYLHSSTIFSSIEAVIENFSDDLTFISYLELRQNLQQELLLFEVPTETSVGKTTITNSQGERFFWIVPTDQQGTERREDLLEKMNHKVEFNERIAVMSCDDNMACFDKLVHTNKLLHKHLFGQDKDWHFVKCNLISKLPVEFTKIELRITRHLTDIMSISDMVIDGKLLGDIHFYNIKK